MSDQPEALRLAEFYEALAEEPPKSPDNSNIRAAAAELRRLSAENESLKRTLAESCDEERSQMWESGGGGGCARALSAEFKCAELLEALKEVVAFTGAHGGPYAKARAAIKAVEEGK